MFIKRWALGLALALAVARAGAQGYPDKQVHLIVPYSAGGITDILARAIGEKLSAAFKQTVIVENKPGNLAIGADYLLHSAADGYTLLMVSESAQLLHGTLSPRMPYTKATRFAPVIAVANSPQGLFVANDVPADGMKSLIDYAKQNPGALTCATIGPGTAPYVNAQILQSAAGIQLTDVSYKGASQALTDLVGGHVKMMIVSAGLASPHFKSSRLKALGVSGDQRTGLLPGVPTFKESGFADFAPASWFSMVTVAGTPDAVIQKLNTEINLILKEPDFVARTLAPAGLEALGGSPADLASRVQGELMKWDGIPAIRIN